MAPKMCNAARHVVLVAASQLLAGSRAACPDDKPRITGLVDGDTPGTDGLPKVVQLYFPCPVSSADDKYEVSLIDAGTSSKVDGATVQLTGLAEKFKDKGGFVYVSPEERIFKEYMGFIPDYTHSELYPTGSGSVELSKGSTAIDVFGAPTKSSEDRKSWDYSKGLAERVYGTDPSIFGTLSDWVIHKGKVKDGASAEETGVGFVEFESCSSYPCPEGHHKPGDHTCKHTACDFTDCRTCCTAQACISKEERLEEAKNKQNQTAPPADCSKISCPPGYIIRDHPAEITCVGGICNDLDLTTCCKEATTPPPGGAGGSGSTSDSGNSMPGSIQSASDLEKESVSFVGSFLGLHMSFGPVTASLATLLLALFVVGGILAMGKAAHRQQCPPPDEVYYPALASEDQLNDPLRNSRE